MRRGTLSRLIAGCASVLVASSGATAFAQMQTGPVTEPRSAQHESSPVTKGAKAITEQREKCSIWLIVNADALFQPHRWTLNHDAAETLDVLGPMITRTGKHPTRILARTAFTDSEAENLDVAQRRATTVRSWLVNHHFVPETTTAEAAKQPHPIAPQKSSEHNNETIEVMIDTCH